MFSEFPSFCFMGVSSNLEVFLSEKHLNDHMEPEFSLLVRPSMEIQDEECQASTREDHEVRQKQQQLVQEHNQEQVEEDHQEQQSNDHVPVLPAAPLGLNLKLEIPSYKEEVEREEENDSNNGFKTPTSPERKIPAILPCPPAPRKPKPKKRKVCCPRIVLDLTSQEIESSFPTPSAVDIGAAGNNKKLKLFTQS